MTVQTEVDKSGPYAGAGTVGPFTVGFRFLAASHLSVIRSSVAGVDMVLLLDTDYSVTGVGGLTGTVTLATALATGEKLTVIRAVPFTQEADYVANDAFPAESHEAALDLGAMRDQQMKERLDAALVLAPSVTGVSTVLPTPSPGQVIAWNDQGNALVNMEAVTLATTVAYGSSVADIFTGNGAQTQYTLSRTPGSQANLDVSIAGVAQVPGIDYTWTSGVAFNMTTAVPNGLTLLVRYDIGLPLGYADASTTVYDGGFAASVLDEAKPMQTYAALRAYTGRATGVRITKYGIAGHFQRDASDLSSADNGGTVIVDAAGRRWKRLVTGPAINAKWFGAVGDGVTDDTLGIQKAIDYAAISAPNYFTVCFPDGSYKASNLLLKHGVTLKGNGPDSCQILVTDTVNSVVTIQNYTHIDGINFYYPNQSTSVPDSVPVVYPFTIKSDSGGSECGSYGTIKNCRAQGSYDFLNLFGVGKFLVKDVDGFPLHRGIVGDLMLDGLNLENVRFNGNFISYADSMRAWVFNNGIAFDIKRVDGMAGNGMFAFGYSKGIVLEGGTGGSANGAKISNFDFDVCKVPIAIANTQDGIFFSNGTCSSSVGYFGSVGSPCSLGAASADNTYIHFSNVTFRNFFGAAIEARGNLKFANCAWDSWNIQNANFDSCGAIQIMASNISIQVANCSMAGNSRAFARGITEDGTYTGYRVDVTGLIENSMAAQTIYLPNGRFSVAASEIGGYRWQGAQGFIRGNKMFIGTSAPSFGSFLDGDEVWRSPVALGQIKSWVFEASSGLFRSTGNL